MNDQEASIDAGVVQDCERMLGLELLRAIFRARGAVRASVAERVDGDDAEVAREVGDLRLPEARWDDRPGCKQQQRVLAAAEGLVAHGEAAHLDQPGIYGLNRARRFPGGEHAHVAHHLTATKSRSIAA